MPGKLAIGASLLQQAERKRKIVPISGDQTKNISHRKEYHVTFHDGGITRSFDLSCFICVPHLAEFFIEAFHAWGKTQSDRTRSATIASLRGGLLKFLEETGQTNVKVEDIDEVLLNAFVQWLNRKQSRKGRALSHSTRKLYLFPIRQLTYALRYSEAWGSTARKLKTRIPRNPWPGSARKKTPTKRLPLEQLREIVDKASAEIEVAEAHLEAVRSLIEQGSVEARSYEKGIASTLDIPSALALLNSRYPTLIDPSPKIREKDRELYRVLCKYGFAKTASGFYPTGRQLVPFVLLISVATAFNPDTILTLNWSDIRETSVLGEDFLRFHGVKRRSSREQVFNVPVEASNGLHFGKILNTLKMWTARIRSIVEPRYRDRIFLFKPLTKPSVHVLDRSDNEWNAHVKSFCSDNGIEYFTLRQVRATILDEVYLREGDIVVAQAVGQHRNPEVTSSHYTSDGTRRRQQERLGEVLALRERWLSSDGKIDPREKSYSDDPGAATYGFYCADPYQSPQSGQAHGRLCGAYGRCPVCPLALADLSDPACVAAYSSLERAIIAARHTMDIRAWSAQWGIVLQEVRALIDRVPASVRDRADALYIHLPPVG